MPCSWKASANFGAVTHVCLLHALTCELLKHCSDPCQWLFRADDAAAAPVLEGIYVSPPAYQTEEGFFRLDLSCLVDDDHRLKDIPDEIKSTDVHAGNWPDQELQQMTTLDHSQLQALKVWSMLLCCIHADRQAALLHQLT